LKFFYAADYFQLLDLQDFIMKIIKNDYVENYSPELLSCQVGRAAIMTCATSYGLTVADHVITAQQNLDIANYIIRFHNGILVRKHKKNYEISSNLIDFII
jgi:hypothetical protein